MSEENVEIVRNIYRAFNERRVDDIMPWCHEDVEWYQAGPFPDAPNVYRGRDKLIDLFGMFLDTFEDFRFDIHRLLDSGDHVAVIGDAIGSGASGLRIELGFVHVCRLRDGLVVWGYDCAGPVRGM